jgi:hypothetical protein
MAEKKANKKSGAPRKRRKLPGKSIGLTPNELVGAAPATIETLERVIENRLAGNG